MTLRFLSISSASILLLLVLLSPLSAQQGRTGNFSLDLSAGLVGTEAFDDSSTIFALTPRWRVASRERFEVTIPLRIARTPNPDPPFSGAPRLCAVCPTCCPTTCLSCPVLEELETGPAWVLAPSVEAVFRPGARLRPGLFVGGGIWREEGGSTTIEELGTFRTGATTRPVAAYGFNLTHDFSDRLSLRLEAGAFTTFGGTTTVRTPAGENVDVEGEDVTSGLISLGLGFRF